MWWLLLIMGGFITGCARGPLPIQPNGPIGHSEQAVVKLGTIAAHKLTPGEVWFLRHCAGCHGAGARGDGPVAAALGLHPCNLRQAGLFPETADPAWINRMLHGRAMSVSAQSSQGMLNDTETDLLVQHVRRLSTLSWSEIDRGEKVYDSLCLSCHGVYGHGDGPVATTLPAPPRDLVAPAYQQRVTDETLFQIISEGKGAMPGSADVLSANDRRAVVAFVRLLTAGYESYDRYCVGCHGHKGQPPSREILDLLGQTETWQQPPSFDQDFFRTRTIEQLHKGIRHMLTLYRAPMPHFAGELTADQVRQVLGYLRALPPTL